MNLRKIGRYYRMLELEGRGEVVSFYLTSSCFNSLLCSHVLSDLVSGLFTLVGKEIRENAVSWFRCKFMRIIDLVINFKTEK